MTARSFAGNLLIVALALMFYCVGTTTFEAFVNYRTWPFLRGF